MKTLLIKEISNSEQGAARHFPWNPQEREKVDNSG